MIIIVVVQYIFDDKGLAGFWVSLLPNFFADVVNVLVTTYLVTHFIQRNHEKKQRMTMYEVFGKDFNKHINNLAGNYLYFLTRNEKFLNYGINELKKLKKDVEDVKNNRSANTILNMPKGRVKVKNMFEGWEHSFIKYYSSMREHSEQLAVIEEETWNLLNQYLDGENIDTDSMNSKDRKLLRMLESEKEKLEDIHNFNLTVNQFSTFYYKYSNELIMEFSEKYEMILPIEIKMSLFRVRNNMEQSVLKMGDYLLSYERLSQQEKKQIEDSLFEIAKELLLLMSYFEGYEDVS